jgi:hypothetical protein
MARNASLVSVNRVSSPIMPLRIWRVTTAALAALTATVTLVGCSSGSTESGHAPVGRTGLASALDLVPDMPAGGVFYTDWLAFGHQDRPGPNTASFAGELLNNDVFLHRDLGIRSTDAQWELDVVRANQPPLVLLGFGENSDLSGLAGKLTRLGYRADGSLFTGAVNPNRMWTIGLSNIGIDRGRHLLAGGRDVTAIRSVLAGPINSLGRARAVTPLLTQVSAKLGHIATAYVSIGTMACVQLSNLMRVSTPQMLDAMRKHFPGTFNPPQAEITALANPTDKTALDALTFPDEGTAQANKASRSAALNMFNTPPLNGPNAVRLTNSAVTGRVLSFILSAQQPDDFRQRVLDQTLGVDICP